MSRRAGLERLGIVKDASENRLPSAHNSARVGLGKMKHTSLEDKLNCKLGEQILWFLFLAEIVCFQALESYSWGVYVMVAIAIIFAIGDIIQSNLRIDLNISTFHKVMLVFCLFCLLSSIWAIDSSRALSKSLTLFELLIFVSIFYMHYSKTKDIDAMLKAIMWAGFLLSLYTIYIVGPTSLFDRISNGKRILTDYANINTIGISASLAIVISIYYFLNEKKGISVLFIIPCILVVAASGSRKAFLVVILGVLLVLIASMRGRKFSYNLFYIVVAVAVLFAVFSVIFELGLFNGTLSRMGGFWALFSDSGALDASAQERNFLIKVGLEQFSRTPVLGIGIDNSFCLVGTYLHNNYVELLCDVGFVGFTLFYLFYLFAILGIWRNRRYNRTQALLIGILLFILLFMDIARVSYFSKTLYIYMMIAYIFGSTVGLENDETFKQDNGRKLNHAQKVRRWIK